MEQLESLLLPALKLEEKLFTGKMNNIRQSLTMQSNNSSSDADNGVPYAAVSKIPGQKIINQKIFVVFENERWWVVGGWKKKFYSDERGAWSDDLGRLPFLRRDLYYLGRDGNGIQNGVLL